MKFLIVLIILLFVDLVYLSIFGKNFIKLIEKIQTKKFKLNLVGAIGSYLLIAVGLYYFIIQDNKPIFDAFILGIVLYGVFDFTNMGLFKDYDLKIGLIDTLWGGTLLATVTFLTYKITSYL